MVKKRRWRSGLSAGEYNYHAKLTLAQVEEIRRLYATEHRRQIDLAKQFNVHQSTISGIVLGHTWQYGNMRGTISAKGAYAD